MQNQNESFSIILDFLVLSLDAKFPEALLLKTLRLASVFLTISFSPLLSLAVDQFVEEWSVISKKGI